MDTEEYINKFRRSKKSFEPVSKFYKVAGEPLVECVDAIMLRGRYPKLRLSDIFIFDPGYLEYLVKTETVDRKLQQIAKEVIRNQSQGADSVARQIALG